MPSTATDRHGAPSAAPFKSHAKALDSRGDTMVWRVAFEDMGGAAGRKVSPPPGYDPSCTYEEVARDKAGFSQVMVKKQQEALWARAQAPAKQVGMMCFMQWMMGNQAHLMTIVMVIGLLYNHVTQILQSANMFRAGTPDLDTLGPRALFCAIQAAGLCFAIYKLNGMGLLPTHASDWQDTTVQPVLEFSAGGVLA